MILKFDWDLETSAGHAYHASLRRNSASNAASCVASEPVLSDVTKCGMLNVAGSEALKRGKFPKSSFRAFKYSSWTVPVAHKSFSIAAAIRDERSAERDKLKAI